MRAQKEKVKKREQELARTSVASLERTEEHLNKSPRDYARIKFFEKEEYIQVPKVAVKIFFRAMKEIAQGKEVSLVTSEQMLSTEEAAGILNVSRPFVVKLLESGAIVFSKVGTHRRVLRSDIEIYKQKMKKERKVNLEKLGKLDQELGLGYED